VPFIALCPYCRAGRIRTPDNAFGMTGKCPVCAADFTLVSSGEPLPAAAKPQAARPVYPIAPPTAVIEPPARAAEIETELLSAAPTARGAPVARPYVPPESDDDEDPPAVAAATIVSLFLVAAGLIASQIPYGRFVTVGVAGLGLLFGVVGCISSGTLKLPVLGTGLHAVLLVVVVLLPSWLGIDSWRPPKIGDDPKVVRQFGPDGLAPTAPAWIGGDRAWQFDDARVQVTSVTPGQVELTAPAGKKNWSKARYLVVTVKVTNVGVARPLPFPKWDLTAAKPDDPVVTLATDAGDKLAPAKVENGFRTAFKAPPQSLLPTHSGEQMFVFQLPSVPTKVLRLELPAAEFGSPTPIRIQLNGSHVPSTGKKSP
jgi:hypothetical protein